MEDGDGDGDLTYGYFKNFPFAFSMFFKRRNWRCEQQQ